VSVANRRAATVTAAAIAGLIAYWAAFYLPVWRGRRYIGWDLVSYNLPLDRYTFEHLRWLSWPLFDPYTYNGVDFAGNIQSGMFYPPKLLLFLVLKAVGANVGLRTYEMFLLLHVLLFSVFTFVVVRRFTRSGWLGLFTAVTLTYAGFFQGQLEHLWYFTTLAWAPLALNELHRAVVGGRRSGYLGYAAVTLVMLLAGYPLLFAVLQLFVFAFVAVAAVAAGVRPTRRTLFDLVAAWVVVLLLAAPVLVPFLALLRHSVADLNQPNLSPRALATAWLPRALGNPASEHLHGTDVTNGYYFAGPLFYLAPLGLVALAVSRRRASLTYLVALLLSLAVLGVAVFTSVVQHSLHLAALRSWTLAGCLFATVALAVLAGAVALQHRWPRGVGIGAAAATILSAALLVGYNTPSGFNTLAGSWNDPRLTSFQLGSPPVWAAIRAASPGFAILSDPGTIRGKPDTWPRVVAVRNFGGFDPTAPTTYLRLLYARGNIGARSESRLATIDAPPALDWLADNGLRYLVTKSDLVPAADPRLHRIYRGRSYDIFELQDPRPLISADGCARISDVSLRPNVLTFDADVTRDGCQARATMNYASGWHAQSVGVHLAPLTGNVGFAIGPLSHGVHHVVLRYRSAPLLVGLALFLLGASICVVGTVVAVIRRRSPRRATRPPRTRLVGSAQ
jgi:hypothetical protein